MPSCRGSHSRWQRSRKRSPPNAKRWRVRAERREGARQPAEEGRQAALAKKIKAQLAGLDLLESLTQDLVKLGMGEHQCQDRQADRRSGETARERLPPRSQAALNAYTNLFASEDGKFDADQSTVKREAIYSRLSIS